MRDVYARFGTALIFVLSSACSSAEEDTGVSTQEVLLDTLFCEGKALLSFDPGITTTPQTVTITSDVLLGTASPDVGACVVIGGAITGGTRHSESQHESSCLQAIESAPVPSAMTFLWNTGSSSTVTFTAGTISNVSGETVSVRTGTVTSGFGSGHSAVYTTTYLNTDLAACLTTGLTSITGVASLLINPL